MIGTVRGMMLSQKEVAGLPAAIASFRSNASGVKLDSLKVLVEAVQSGSGTPSPDNVRPITGRSGANVTRCGVNIWDEEWESGYWNVTTGLPVVNADYIRCKNFLSVKPNTTFCLSNSATSLVNNEVLFFDIDKNLLNPSYTDVKGNATFTTPANCYFIKFYMNINYGRTYNNDISINYPSTDTAYHAYNGNQYSSYFSGILNGTYGFVDLGTLNYVYSSNMFINTELVSLIKPATSNSVAINGVSDLYDITSYNGLGDVCLAVSTAGNIFIKNSSYTDIQTFKEAMSGVYLIYELATPTTPTITQEQMDTLVKAFGVEKMSAIVVFGDTYYGGELDVTNGVLTIKGRLYTTTWTQFNQNNGYKAYRSSSYIQAKSYDNAKSNMIGTFGSFSSSSMNKNIIQLPIDSSTFVYMALDENADPTAVQIYYELATPIEIQLTPQQIEQLEENNIWADSGDVSECKYSDRVVTVLFSKG